MDLASLIAGYEDGFSFARHYLNILSQLRGLFQLTFSRYSLFRLFQQFPQVLLPHRCPGMSPVTMTLL